MARLGLPLLFLMAGCGHDEFASPPHPSGSSTLAISGDGEAIWAASIYDDSVVRLDRSTGARDTLYPGREPSRVAVVGDRVLVTIAGAGALAEIEDGTPPELLRLVSVGSEPVGVVATADGDRVYVAISGEDQVLELDGSTLEVRRRFPVEGQPAWLALHPSGEALYVASILGGRLSWIDLRLDSATAVAVEFPGAVNLDDEPFALRLTGDLSVDDGGTRLAVPILYVDDKAVVSSGSSGGYTSGGGGSRLRPAVGLVTLDAAGAPVSASAIFTIVPESVTAFGRTQPVLRSLLSAVDFTADGTTVAATMEGSDVVVLLDISLWEDERCSIGVAGDSGGQEGVQEDAVVEPFGLTLGADQVIGGELPTVPAAAVWVHTGPRGFARNADGDLLVHSFLDRHVDALDHRTIVGLLDLSQILGDTVLYAEFTASVGALVDSVPQGDVEEGRRLFFSATNERLSDAGSGISCSTCHFQGRNDGLTWPHEEGDRQTPSLAGGVADSAPFAWDGTVTTVAQEAQETVSNRMFGTGLEPDDLDAIAAWVEVIRAPEPPSNLDPAAISRGQERFAAFGCVTCHLPPSGTDGLVHWVNGAYLDTPTLEGVAMTPPYYHDGSAETLGEVLATAADVGMGEPFSASEQELADLEAYLRSL